MEKDFIPALHYKSLNNQFDRFLKVSMKETKSEKKEAVKIYSFSMHPEVKSDKPGKCPKCGMDLIEKK
jgi:hypothetical protein